MSQTIENGEDQTLDLAIHVIITVKSNEAVKQQGGKSVNRRPHHKVGARTRRFGEEANIDQSIQLCDQHVMWVRRNYRLRLASSGREH